MVKTSPKTTAAKKAAFLDLFDSGASAKDAAKLIGISQPLPSNWRHRDPEFRARYDELLRKREVAEIGPEQLGAWRSDRDALLAERAEVEQQRLEWSAPAAMMGNANARRQLDKAEQRLDEIDDAIAQLDLVLASAEQHIAAARERRAEEQCAAARAEVADLREQRQKNAARFDRLLRELNECAVREQELGAAEQSAGRKANVRIRTLHHYSLVQAFWASALQLGDLLRLDRRQRSGCRTMQEQLK